MPYRKSVNDLLKKILEGGVFDFEEAALFLFDFQYKNNLIYRQYAQALNKNKVTCVADIPFLPISFFKTHRVAVSQKHEVCFESSGTTSANPSKHFVENVSWYEKSFVQGFENHFGNLSEYEILALLPSYLDRGNASLVYMANGWMKKSKNQTTHFFAHDYVALNQKIASLEQQAQKYILLGVTYALIEFAHAHPRPLKYATIIETGGMKGMAKEITRYELYELLFEQFQTKQIVSEYGMTELLSQAYTAPGTYYFQAPRTMSVFIRDIYNPFEWLSPSQSGGINIIDLVNAYSCPFIETADLGKLDASGKFEVLGRLDNSEIRGCNLMQF